MEIPYQAWMFARILKRYLPMERNGEIFATRKSLKEEGLNIDEVDFGFGYLRSEGVITDLKVKEAMELINDDVYEDHDDRHFHISVNREKLEKLLIDADAPSEEKTSAFDQKTSTLKVGYFIVQIPPYKNEYDFCKAIFSHPPKHLVDWEEIHQQMTGDEEVHNVQKAKRKIYDVLQSLNSKIAKASDGRVEKLFHWKIKTMSRDY